ncbi:low molecular weight protein tyrosine phosphatase family protein [Paenibacillus assamensis]|uniref:low molecular weight protein tyrosine phosphatase family protein n=1 Tax=Paenibacillus assamensis TaxID=311244 RepID=UPI00048E3430|nr:protein-tyrosine-phosphatase [Paenibacillus assamensis]
MKLLFVCSKNKWRSLTAETVFSDLTEYNVRSAGTEDSARIKVTGGHIGWADIIFVMEKKHIRRIRDKYNQELINKKMICLDIPDDFTYMDEELIETLKSRVSEHIEIPENF